MKERYGEQKQETKKNILSSVEYLGNHFSLGMRRLPSSMKHNKQIPAYILKSRALFQVSPEKNKEKDSEPIKAKTKEEQTEIQTILQSIPVQSKNKETNNINIWICSCLIVYNKKGSRCMLIAYRLAGGGGGLFLTLFAKTNELIFQKDLKKYLYSKYLTRTYKKKQVILHEL